MAVHSKGSILFINVKIIIIQNNCSRADHVYDVGPTTQTFRQSKRR